MWIGPLNKSDFLQVKAVFEGAAVPYELHIDPVDPHTLLSSHVARGPQVLWHPFTLTAAPGTIFVGFADADALRVGASLKALGFDPIPAVAPELEPEEELPSFEAFEAPEAPSREPNRLSREWIYAIWFSLLVIAMLVGFFQYVA